MVARLHLCQLSNKICTRTATCFFKTQTEYDKISVSFVGTAQNPSASHIVSD